MTAGGGGADDDEEKEGGGRRNGGQGVWFSRGNKPEAADDSAGIEATQEKSTVERFMDGTLLVNKFNSFLATNFGEVDVVDSVLRDTSRPRRRMLQFVEDGGR